MFYFRFFHLPEVETVLNIILLIFFDLTIDYYDVLSNTQTNTMYTVFEYSLEHSNKINVSVM
jgi:hypothetical protein